ncbi:N-6 DNA methylase [Micromonospora endophytica]|uniref:N-6 DNA methylase n=1 Tax=Micromonospora endophytica TaxID=515350 RepID=UPI001BB306BC|nr:N-6 DNA methylase [Micromonospora endophytica]BCJ58997.1 hypothetical protein Jiend_24190 [Micromonospora endophytica]
MSDSRQLFRDLRNYLAGQHLGATQDRHLLQEVLKILLCKARLDSSMGVARSRADAAIYRTTWEQVQESLPHLFGGTEHLKLQDQVIEQVDRLLASLDLGRADIDPFADLYETFTGNMARGQEGQFFTPPNAVELLVSMVAPKAGEVVLDPACGAGGFLAQTAHFWNRHRPRRNGQLIGIDKDAELARLTALRMALMPGVNADTYCADSLAWKSSESHFPQLADVSPVDVILTNPPFGSKIVAVSGETQRQFRLAHRWTRSKGSLTFTQSSTLVSNVSPQVVFIERCLSLLRPGGRLGMVLPESLLSSQRYQYVVQFLRDQAKLEAVVGMPENLFKVSGSGGTHTKTCLLVATKHKSKNPATSTIFMAEAKWCGNDSRGRKTERDELPEIGRRYSGIEHIRNDHLGYEVAEDQLQDNILAPRYYDPEPVQQLLTLKRTHDLVSVGKLISDGILEVRSGHEVGKDAYGTGDIPFVRTSDISNWEVKLDPKHGVSEEIYNRYASLQDVREGDILMVRDGTYLIGTCAYVSKYDQKIVYQSHLLKLRVTDHSELSPFLLLAALSSAPVKRQIRAKRFTMDIIDTLGNRLSELVLPLPRDPQLRISIADQVATVIRDRVEARELARQACLAVAGDLGEADADLNL